MSHIDAYDYSQEYLELQEQRQHEEEEYQRIHGLPDFMCSDWDDDDEPDWDWDVCDEAEEEKEYLEYMGRLYEQGEEEEEEEEYYPVTSREENLAWEAKYCTYLPVDPSDLSDIPF